MVNQVGNSMQWMHAKRQIERQRQQCTNRNSTVIGVEFHQLTPNLICERGKYTSAFLLLEFTLELHPVFHHRFPFNIDSCGGQVCTLGCFSKDTLKKKCPPHHITWGYLERSYPEGEADKTSQGSPLTLKVWQNRRRRRIWRRPRNFALWVLLLVF